MIELYRWKKALIILLVIIMLWGIIHIYIKWDINRFRYKFINNYIKTQNAKIQTLYDKYMNDIHNVYYTIDHNTIEKEWDNSIYNLKQSNESITENQLQELISITENIQNTPEIDTSLPIPKVYMKPLVLLISAINQNKITQKPVKLEGGINDVNKPNINDNSPDDEVEIKEIEENEENKIEKNKREKRIKNIRNNQYDKFLKNFVNKSKTKDYKSYTQYCKNNNQKPLELRTFSKLMNSK